MSTPRLASTNTTHSSSRLPSSADGKIGFLLVAIHVFAGCRGHLTYLHGHYNEYLLVFSGSHASYLAPPSPVVCLQYFVAVQAQEDSSAFTIMRVLTRPGALSTGSNALTASVPVPYVFRYPYTYRVGDSLTVSVARAASSPSGLNGAVYIQRGAPASPASAVYQCNSVVASCADYVVSQCDLARIGTHTMSVLPRAFGS